MRRNTPLTAVTVLLLTAIVARTEPVYVNIDTAEIRDSQSVSSRVVAQVKRGDKLSVLRHENHWYHVVTSQGQQGWIYQYKVTVNPPQNTGDVFALLGSSSSGMEMNEASSASGIRGLNPVSERQARRRGRRDRDIKAVKRMERFRVSSKAFQNFLRVGKLGEYQEGS